MSIKQRQEESAKVIEQYKEHISKFHSTPAFDRKSYAFSDDELKQIGAWVLLPHEMRMELMEKFFAGKDPQAIMSMFSNFIDLAHTTVENCEEQAWSCAVGIWGADPNEADKLNMPSLAGAITGVKLSQGVEPNHLCHGCAYRRGSVANTCMVTTFDAAWCHGEFDQPFMCHENIKDDEEPTQKCRGFLKKEKIT